MKGKNEERDIQKDTNLTLEKTKGLAQSLTPSSKTVPAKRISQSSYLPAGPLLPPSRNPFSAILLSVHSAGSSIRLTLGPRL
jgi:hypothetical protein